MAVQAIADRAGLETTFSPGTIPLGARVSMKADDVTVAAALRWVLVNARVDVLIQNDTGLTLVPKASLAAGEDSSGVLAGDLVDNETGEPVPYGTVTLLGTEFARFTDRGGHFRMTRLSARRYILRARQIGYSPVDSTVAVARGSTTRLTMLMRRVPAMLGLVRITGHRAKECVATGIPDSTVDPTLAAIFVQIRENVDRYNLLLKEYPFRYAHVEQQVRRWPRAGDLVEFMDTVVAESQERRPYRVGGIIYNALVMRRDSVFQDRSGPGGTTRVFVGMQNDVTARRRLMNMPSFADLVDPAFLAAHCFQYGGTTGGKDSAHLIRVDFEAAKSIKTPDVSGSVYLDADSLVLRRAVFELTKPEAAKPPVHGFTVTATFRQIVPLVPIVDSFESLQPIGWGQTALGSDRLIDFAFEGLTPGGEAAASSQRTTVASAARRDTAVASPTAMLVVDPGLTRVRAVFPADSSCRPAPAVDTISVILYGTLYGRRPRGPSDTAWSTYTNGVLSAFSQSFALPDTLSLSAFSWPFEYTLGRVAPRPYRAVADRSAAQAPSPAVVPPIDSSRPRSGVLAVLVLNDAGDPVPFAAVRLAGTAEPRLTDSIGFSRIRRLYPGAYLLQVRRIGYAPQDTTITVRAGPAVTTATIHTGRVAARLAVVSVPGRNVGPLVVPMISTVVTLTLGTDGSLRDVRLTASSTSQTTDSLVLAAVRRAAAADAFPRFEGIGNHRDSVTARLVVSIVEPAPGEQVVALGRLNAPAWSSLSGVRQAKETSISADLVRRFLLGHWRADTAVLEFVVGDTGQALPTTAHLEHSGVRPLLAADRERYARRVVSMLSKFRYDAGRIAGCRVPEFVREAFGYRVWQ